MPFGVMDSQRPYKPYIMWGRRSPPPRKKGLTGSHLGMPKLAGGRYSQPYSLGGRSDASSGYLAGYLLLIGLLYTINRHRTINMVDASILCNQRAAADCCKRLCDHSWSQYNRLQVNITSGCRLVEQWRA